jgi:hypothetical protein
MKTMFLTLALSLFGVAAFAQSVCCDGGPCCETVMPCCP